MQGPDIALRAKIKTTGQWVVAKMQMQMHVVTKRRIYLHVQPLAMRGAGTDYLHCVREQLTSYE